MKNMGNKFKDFFSLRKMFGAEVTDIDFGIYLENGRKLSIDNFDISIKNDFDDLKIIEGQSGSLNIEWTFQKKSLGWVSNIALKSGEAINCSHLESIVITYSEDTKEIDNLFVPLLTSEVNLPCKGKVSDVLDKEIKSIICGAFENSEKNGFFIGGVFPLKYIYNCSLQKAEGNSIRFIARTYFIPEHRKNSHLFSESTLICNDMNIRTAIKELSVLQPEVKNPVLPPVGWNSWDYYFRDVSLEDVIKNMEEIKKDKLLAEKIKYIVVDDGWQHAWGEWEENYKFPGGIERLCKEIKDRGFIPGIWCAPVQVEGLTRTALREYEMLVKNKYGDPLDSEVAGHYMIDPTHPKGRVFIKELYTKLYRAGFRLFKVDFVRQLLDAEYFYDREKGPYEVIKELFSIIREAVTDESYIIGCSLPSACGSGVADSGRTGIDIHNQWEHVKWVVDTLQWSSWENRRVWINDVDFLVVRGKDTSLEAETNVLNPNKNNPLPPRWRRGEVFDYNEARTWASLVIMSGGNIFLSDRIKMLNEKGMEIVRKALVPTGIAAEPLDLCESERPSIWLQDLEKEYRVLIINWSDSEKEISFIPEKYGISFKNSSVMDFWNGEKINIENEQMETLLKAHESKMFSWDK